MLSGTLDDFTLADVLRLIAGARRTGGLSVARDGGAGSLFFRDGTVSRAVPRYERRTDAVSPARAIEDLAFDLMRWERGEFTWTPDASTPAGPEASLEVDELLTAVSRRLEELDEIHRLVPSEEAVLTMAAQAPEGAVQINIAPAEWRVLVLVDGHRTVSEIAGAAHLDDLEAMKLLYGLAAAGLVEAQDHVPAEATSDMAEVISDEEQEAEEPIAVEPPVEEPLVAVTASASDPFLAGLAMEPASPFDEMPAAPVEGQEAPAGGRAPAARELAGLFDDVDPMASLGGMTLAAPPAPPRTPRRVEDDDQVTRGLISRLIDGVKGL